MVCVERFYYLDDDGFASHFRMNRQTFEVRFSFIKNNFKKCLLSIGILLIKPTVADVNFVLLQLFVLEFGNHLQRRGRLLRLRTGLDVCLLMAPWILGNLSSFRGVGVIFGVSRSVVHFHYLS